MPVRTGRTLAGRVPGGPEALWITAYGAVTVALMALGVYAMLSFAMVAPGNALTVVLLVVLGFGTFAASPVLARVLVVGLRRRMPAPPVEPRL